MSCTNRQEFDEALERIGKAASIIWSIANSDNFHVVYKGEFVGHACCEAFDRPKIEWVDPDDPESYPPAKLRRKLYRWLARAGYLTTRPCSPTKLTAWRKNMCPSAGWGWKISDDLKVWFFEREIWEELDDGGIVNC